MRKLAIAMVAACPFPANRGTPSRIKGMAEALARRGHRVAVTTYHFGIDTPTRGIEVHRIRSFSYRYLGPGPSLSKLFVLDPSLLLTSLRLLRRERFDLIHAHHFEGALVGYAARRFTGLPVIYDAHTTLESELSTFGFHAPRRVAAWIDRRVPRWSDHVIAVSESMRDSILASGLPAGRVDVVPTGADLDAFGGRDPSGIRSRHDLDGARVVMYTGSLDDFQRVDLLIEAMAKVVAKDPDAVLVLVAPSAREEIGRLCARHGLEGKVVVAEEPLFERVPEYLSAADVVALPRFDCPGIPQKLVNYMAAGRAIVAFDGSAKLLTDRENGLVVPDADTGALADAILELLGDAPLRQRLGARAQQTVRGRLDWQSLAEEVEGIYHRVLETRARVRRAD